MPRLQGGATTGHGSLVAGGGVVQPREGEGVDWLGDKGDRAETLGWAWRNQLEKGCVWRALRSTLLLCRSNSNTEVAK